MTGSCGALSTAPCLGGNLEGDLQTRCPKQRELLDSGAASSALAILLSRLKQAGPALAAAPIAGLALRAASGEWRHGYHRPFGAARDHRQAERSGRFLRSCRSCHATVAIGKDWPGHSALGLARAGRRQEPSPPISGSSPPGQPI